MLHRIRYNYAITVQDYTALIENKLEGASPQVSRVFDWFL